MDNIKKNNINKSKKIEKKFLLKKKLIGFLLSIFLTVLPFYLVIKEFLIRKEIILIIVIICAILQVSVHFMLFVYTDYLSKNKWNLITLFFTIFVVLVFFIGSLWIMHHLNENLM